MEKENLNEDNLQQAIVSNDYSDNSIDPCNDFDLMFNSDRQSKPIVGSFEEHFYALESDVFESITSIIQTR